MHILEYPNSVPREWCERVIAKFESDPRRRPSTVGNEGEVSQFRTGTLLRIGVNNPDWEPLLQPLVPVLQQGLARYAEAVPAFKTLLEREKVVCTFPPLIERVDPGQGFTWHYDQSSAFQDRVLACLLYLRDVRNGGATEFSEQKRQIEPAAGKMLLFPPFWTHLHRGVAPASETKYVMSCFWIYPRMPVDQVPPAPPARRGLVATLTAYAARKLGMSPP